MTTFNEKDIENKVSDIYKAYQKLRTEDTINKPIQMFDDARPNNAKQNSVADSSNSDCSENDEYVLSAYRAYQSSRDLYLDKDRDIGRDKGRDKSRDKIFPLIMNAAREKIRDQHLQPVNVMNDPSHLSKNTVQSKNNRVLAWPATLLTKAVDWFASAFVNTWRISVPITMLVVIATISFLRVEDNFQEGHSVAYAGIPAVLVAHAADLSEVIRPSLDMTFGFSAGRDVRNTAFRLGVLVTDLPLLVKANNDGAALNLLEKVRQLTEQTHNDTLLASIQALEATLNNSEVESEQLNSRMLALINAVSAHYSSQNFSSQHLASQNLDSIYKLGKWVELTLLATQIQHQALDNKLLLSLFNQRNVISRDVLEKLHDEPAAITLLEDLQKFNLRVESNPENMRALRYKLRQIKALLS